MKDMRRTRWGPSDILPRWIWASSLVFVCPRDEAENHTRTRRHEGTGAVVEQLGVADEQAKSAGEAGATKLGTPQRRRIEPVPARLRVFVVRSFPLDMGSLIARRAASSF
jgi:hypothetical protein